VDWDCGYDSWAGLYGCEGLPKGRYKISQDASKTSLDKASLSDTILSDGLRS